MMGDSLMERKQEEECHVLLGSLDVGERKQSRVRPPRQADLVAGWQHPERRPRDKTGN